jgi:serine protease AprX
MTVRIVIFALLTFCAGQVAGQVNRYMVFFGDKSGSSYTVDQPGEFLSQRAIDRRQKQSIEVVEQDLPVVETYVASVKTAGASVLYRTKWMNGVLVECDHSLVSSIEALPFVTSVEYVAPGSRPSPSGKKRAGLAGNTTSGTAEATDAQLSMLGIDEMHGMGYRGEGILIAVCDAGFLGADVVTPFQHIFQDGRYDPVTSYDFVHGGHEVFKHDDHGTRAFSILGAFQDGSFIGGAYHADYVLFVTEDVPTEYRVEEFNWLFAAERADSAGVNIISVSLGYNTFDDPLMDYSKMQMDGETAIITQAAEWAAAKGMAVVVSAGNEGNNSWGIITAPADGRNVYAVGAVTGAGERSVSSSTGPSSDGRIKPDVMALGTGVSVVRANGSVSTSSGTSFSAPLVASLIAGVWQMLPDLSVKQVLDTIRNTASRANSPDNFMGYGIPNFLSVLQITSAETSGATARLVDVFPNPFSDQFIVRAVHPYTADQVHAEVLDVRGSRVDARYRKDNSHELVIDLSGNQPGVYVLQVRVNNRISTHKLLKVD